MQQYSSVLSALGWTFLPGVRPFSGSASGEVLGKGDAVRIAVLATIMLTALFYAPALMGGYMADDQFHIFALSELPEVFHRQLNLFAFLQTPEEIHVMKKWGMAPWWTSHAPARKQSRASGRSRSTPSASSAR